MVSKVDWSGAKCKEDAWAVSDSKETRLRQSDQYYFDRHLLFTVTSHQTPLALWTL